MKLPSRKKKEEEEEPRKARGKQERYYW